MRCFICGFVTLTVALIASGCGGGSSADEIANGLRSAARQTDGEVGDSVALKATCDALQLFGSEAGDSLSDFLVAEAKTERVTAGQTLFQYDSQAPEMLIDAADEIDDAQKASEVLSILCQ